ncbi:MAG: multiubiquitin domain-containing protein [Phycisphaerales bacterium]|nr:multiubiquitin domain-containing protein [Phycisphaerales bacterium]
MRRVFVNGQEVTVPVDYDGCIDADELRELAGIERSRPLLLKRLDGGNEVINPGETVSVRPGQHFQDMPLHKRGVGHETIAASAA